MEVRFATASGPKLCPQQSFPEVAFVAADRMRFRLSYVKSWVSPVSTPLMMPVTLPLLPVDVDEHPVDKEKEVKQGAKFIAVPFEEEAAIEVVSKRLLYCRDSVIPLKPPVTLP